MLQFSANNSNLQIVLILTVGFSFAALLGYFSHRAKLSPILGYLIAGYLIGPYSPGFVADLRISEQLAEIGIVLMMFGIGLHLQWSNLLKVKKIAIPGALGQTLLTTLVVATWSYFLGWSLESGIIFGLAIGVASTVVMARVLDDNRLLESPEGNLAIGWLILEDLITVVAILLLPVFVASSKNQSALSLGESCLLVLWTVFKFILLSTFLFTVGQKLVKWALLKVMHTKSSELFTLALLAFTFVIACGSTLLFGTSIALGALLAGMVIHQTEVRYQAATNAMPMKDAFLVIFFLSVGMLFNPAAIFNHFSLFAGVLFIILLLKPLAALLITSLLHYPFKKALIVSVALAQVGEFSFVLAEEAMKLSLLPEAGYDIIVACSFISISLNPLLFKLLSK